LLAWLGLLITMMLSGEAGSASRMAQWFVSLGMSETTAQSIMFALRKSIHVLGYAAVAVTAARLVPRERWFFALMWGLLLASADELRQSREATRTGTWTDVAIDAVGMGLGLALWYGYTRRKAWSGDS
jgi:VanZ family protein